MTVTEKIIAHLQCLPEALRGEVLDFVQYLETKGGGCKIEEETEWPGYSLSSAMRDMEGEPSPYTMDDLRELF